jgi:FKBP-type peptidyl-prolyl cis-trans isomerase
MIRNRWWALVLVVGLAAGCGGDGEPAAEDGGDTETDAAAETSSGAAEPGGSGATATDFDDVLEVRLDEMEESEDGLRWRILEPGDGATAEQGDTAVVHYTGWLPDGTKFDSSRDRGEPFQFVVGAGQVIQGWDRGVAGMQEGELRQLVIPPSLGYGQRGAGNVIPPGATLVFEVELLRIGEPAGG